MKYMILAVVVFAGQSWAADEALDRAAIENTIRVLNMAPSTAGLFTSDFDPAELERFKKAYPTESGAIPIDVDGKPGTLVISKAPMGEAQWFPAGVHGNIAVKKIRFVTAEVAMVDAMGKSPVLIVLKKVAGQWKVASVRVLAEAA